MKKILCAAVCAALSLSLFGCSGEEQPGPGGSTTRRAVSSGELQFTQPAEGAPIATISTTMGDITVVLYPDQAPMAVENFKNRGYAKLGGIILNRRNVKHEEEKVQELCEDIHSRVIGTLSRSETVTDAEELAMTVLEACPDSEMAQEYRKLAEEILAVCREER